MKAIYDENFVKDLFNKMSASYTLMNRITSFGFSEKWRRQFVEELDITDGSVVVDFMTGMGECWSYVFANTHNVELIAIDFSPEMLKNAIKQQQNFATEKITLLEENVLKCSLENNSVDFLISGFGLKTFNEQQLNELAQQVRRVLKPGGNFSLVDVSIPESKLLKVPYIFYLKNVIPQLGKLFLGNPETYKMLGIYTEQYVNSQAVEKIFEANGLEVSYLKYFYGCASGIKGSKPS
jgi:demethylmenaquinone methyltransferase/2-methoxy-6-polyprenyl-1,4-benzoquinol methylase